MRRCRAGECEASWTARLQPSANRAARIGNAAVPSIAGPRLPLTTIGAIGRVGRGASAALADVAAAAAATIVAIVRAMIPRSPCPTDRGITGRDAPEATGKARLNSQRRTVTVARRNVLLWWVAGG